MTKIFWGDLHNHNEIGYAEGSLERSFALARNALDFYAFTPHGWWTDVPKNDQKIREHHEAGFARVKSRWDEVREKVREENTPGEFITFSGWEWHSMQWGDYCVYFPGDHAELSQAGTLDELKELARRTGAILIPHHPAYRLGWRGLDWDSLDSDFSPVVEIFSEHGNSLESTSPWGMYSHSMGGMDTTQSGLEQLRRGRRFGFLASGDDHYGYPGAYGQGLTAVLATELSRHAVMDALRSRHTYAVTGDRIEVAFHANEGIMGDEIEPTDQISLRARVFARDRLRSVEILKNARHWRRYGPESQTGQPNDDEHLVRLEWGWDLLSSTAVTTWEIDLEVEGSAIRDVVPAFCGGEGSTTELNLLSVRDERGLHAKTYTSRRNTRPVNSLSFVWKGPASATLKLRVNGRNGDRPFTRQLDIRKSELAHEDRHVSAFDLFSSPKVKVHALIDTGERSMMVETEDDQAARGDFYILKVEQENGQLAWSSPIWLGGV